MHRSPRFFLAALLSCLPAVGLALKPAEPPPVTATIETTLTTAGNHIRQLAFDGDLNTYFASAQNPTTKDHFTLVFDQPVEDISEEDLVPHQRVVVTISDRGYMKRVPLETYFPPLAACTGSKAPSGWRGSPSAVTSAWLT